MIECHLRAAMSDRLKQARAALGLTQKEWCEATGMPLQTLKQYEGLKRLPGSESLCLYARSGVSANWLLTGEGPMLLKDLAHQVEPLPVLDDLDGLEEQPIPESQDLGEPAMALDAAVLAVCIRGVLEARPEATPAQTAKAAVEFYQRLMQMEAGQDTDAA